MKIKTAEATGLRLDWGVAVVMGYTPAVKKDPFNDRVYVDVAEDTESQYVGFLHTDPAVCIGLIKEYKIDITHESNCICASGQEWSAEHDLAYGKTPEQAVARCVISMGLGDEFDVPDELGGDFVNDYAKEMRDRLHTAHAEIATLKAQCDALLAAQEGTPCKHKFNAVVGGVLSCTHCYASFSEQ